MCYYVPNQMKTNLRCCVYLNKHLDFFFSDATYTHIFLYHRNKYIVLLDSVVIYKHVFLLKIINVTYHSILIQMYEVFFLFLYVHIWWKVRFLFLLPKDRWVCVEGSRCDWIWLVTDSVDNTPSRWVSH